MEKDLKRIDGAVVGTDDLFAVGEIERSDAMGTDTAGE